MNNKRITFKLDEVPDSTHIYISKNLVNASEKDPLLRGYMDRIRDGYVSTTLINHNSVYDKTLDLFLELCHEIDYEAYSFQFGEWDVWFIKHENDKNSTIIRIGLPDDFMLFDLDKTKNENKENMIYIPKTVKPKVKFSNSLMNICRKNADVREWVWECTDMYFANDLIGPRHNSYYPANKLVCKVCKEVVGNDPKLEFVRHAGTDTVFVNLRVSEDVLGPSRVIGCY